MKILLITLMLFGGFSAVATPALPTAVQKLVQNEARFREKALQMKHQKEAKAFKKLFESATINHRCDDDDDPTTCVRNCTNRYSDGTCYSYGKDYCGTGASCVAHCSNRYSDGKCYSYSSDYCGDNVSCIENCTNRYSDGRCYSYGSDICY